MFDNGGFPLGVDGRIHLKKKRGKIVVYQKANLYVKKTKLWQKVKVNRQDVLNDQSHNRNEGEQQHLTELKPFAFAGRRTDVKTWKRNKI